MTEWNFSSINVEKIRSPLPLLTLQDDMKRINIPVKKMKLPEIVKFIDVSYLRGGNSPRKIFGQANDPDCSVIFPTL